MVICDEMLEDFSVLLKYQRYPLKMLKLSPIVW